MRQNLLGELHLLSIGTRSQNKNVHPGKPVLDAKQNRRLKQEIEEVRAQKSQQVDEEKARLTKGLKTAAQIEDKILQEDIQRRTSNHREVITPFNPHLRAAGSDVAPKKKLSAASEHEITECGWFLSSEKKSLTILQAVDDAAQLAAQNTAYDDEASEGSQDEFLPPPCEDEDIEEVLTTDESEADESEKETKKSKKGKKSKPGRKDVVAVRETTAHNPTPTTTKDGLKRKADDATA